MPMLGSSVDRTSCRKGWSCRTCVAAEMTGCLDGARQGADQRQKQDSCYLPADVSGYGALTCIGCHMLLLLRVKD